MKQSEAVKIVLSSYHFQEGRRVDRKVVSAVNKTIKRLEKEEIELDGK